MLVERGGNVSAMDSLLRTPLECAAKWGRTDFAKLMLDKGAKVHSDMLPDESM